MTKQPLITIIAPLILLACVSAAQHDDFPNFSKTHDVTIIDNQLRVTDTAVYQQAYYASDGDEGWTPFQLQGTALPNAEGWLTGITDYNLPPFNDGEHYIITYSCTYDAGWDCHGGRWQLRIINNEPTPTCTDGIQNQDETGIDCGGTCEPCNEQGYATIQTVVESSGATGSLVAYATDDDYTTNWASYGDGEWLQFDLGTTQEVVAVDIAFYKGDERHAFFTIQTSTDGNDWQEAYDGQSSGTTLALQRFAITSTNARYVRIVGHGNDDDTTTSRPYNSYTEVKVVIDGVEPCEPESSSITCQGKECGAATNNCGQQVICGTCDDSEWCEQGTCKEEMTGDEWPTNAFNIIWENGFDHNTPGQYDEEEVYADWGSNPSSGTRADIVADPDGGQNLKVTYPAGVDTAGFQVIAPIEQGHEELYYLYQVRFKPKMAFNGGAKLPGLAARGTDGKTVAGGSGTYDGAGFSARMNFRWVDRLATYLYHHDQPTNYGEVFYFYDDLPQQEDYHEINKVEDAWHTIVQRVVLNSVPSPGQGANDGILETWVDGKLVQQLTDIRFRNYESISIDLNFFCTFYGGSGEMVWPHREEWALFDNIRVFTYDTDNLPPGESIPIGRTPSSVDRELHLPAGWERVTTIPEADENKDQRILINLYGNYPDEPPLQIDGKWWNHLSGNWPYDDNNEWHLYNSEGEWSGILFKTLTTPIYTQQGGYTGTSYPNACEESMWRADRMIGKVQLKQLDIGKEYTLKALSNYVSSSHDTLLTFRGETKRIVVEDNTELAEWQWTADQEEETLEFVGDGTYGRLNLLELIEHADP